MGYFTNPKKAKKWGKRGSKMGEGELNASLQDWGQKFLDAQALGNPHLQKRAWSAIQGLGGNVSGFDPGTTRESLVGGSNPWASTSSTGTTEQNQDVNLNSSLGDLTNVPGYGDISTTVPPWLDVGNNPSWQDIAQSDLMLINEFTPRYFRPVFYEQRGAVRDIVFCQHTIVLIQHIHNTATANYDNLRVHVIRNLKELDSLILQLSIKL